MYKFAFVRYYWVTGKEPLTYYDMNLSAQDHQVMYDSNVVMFDYIFKMGNMRSPNVKTHRSCFIEINRFKHNQFGLAQLTFLNRTLFRPFSVEMW